MEKLFEILIQKEVADNIAIIETSGEQYTYKYIKDRAWELSEKLRDCNTNILILFPSKIEFVIALFAVLLADKTAVPISKQLTETEIIKIAKSCSADTLLVYDEFDITIDDCIRKITYNIKDVNMGNKGNNLEYKNELAMLFPTSGTFGEPKLVKLTHENIISELHALRDNFEVTATTCELSIVPLYTIASCVGHLLVVMFAGARLVLYDGKINPVKIFALIDKYSVEITGCPPTLLSTMLGYLAPDSFQLDTLKIFILGGEQVTHSQILSFQKYLDKVKFLPTYGLTEASSIVTGVVNDELRADSVGRALQNFDIKIIKEDNCYTVPFEIGEIIIQGDSVTKGYYGLESDETLIRNNWLYTGDLGYMDNDGYLYVTGRTKNIIIIAGQNVSIEEVEQVLLSNEKILLAKVYSYWDEKLGVAIGAEIVLKKSLKLEAHELSCFCKERLANYKIPSKFEFVENIDTIGMGKKKRC